MKNYIKYYLHKLLCLIGLHEYKKTQYYALIDGLQTTHICKHCGKNIIKEAQND